MSNTQVPITCENCNRTIGKLEPRYTWQNHIVCGECFTRLSAPVAPPLAAGTPTTLAEPAAVPAEAILFEGHPSILTALSTFALFAASFFAGTLLVIWGLLSLQTTSGKTLIAVGLLGALASALVILIRYLKIKFIHYRLSSQRLFITTGILAKKTVEVELFRIRDLSVQQTFFQRLLGIGSILAVSTDSDIPKLDFYGIRDPLKIKELLRQHIMESRQRTRTRDLDISDLPGSV